MKFSTKAARLILPTLLLAAVFVAVGGVAAQSSSPKILITGRNMGPNDLATQDPSLMQDVPSVQVASEMFSGLTNLNELTSEIGPGTASYDVSADGLTYTLHIQDNIPWVHYNATSGAVEEVKDDSGNVRMLTAQDYYYGIIRTLDPQTAGPYTYVLTPWLVGANDFSTSDPKATDAFRQELINSVGLKVIDDHTLQFTSTTASSVVPMILSMWVTWAEPKWAIDANADLWTDPANINTYGPYTMKDWTRGDGGSLTLIKNPFWPGTPNSPVAKIDEVQNDFLDKDPQLANFEAGTLGVSEVPVSAIDRIKSDATLSKEYFVGPGSDTYSYMFNPANPPFDDQRARLAFSEDINRQAIVENVTKGGELPASYWSLPNLVGAPSEANYPGQGVYYNQDDAKQQWQAYLTATGHKASDFTITFGSNSTALHDSIIAVVQQQWQQDLGVTVQYVHPDFPTFLQNRNQYDVFRFAWGYDYPDDYNFLHDAIATLPTGFAWTDPAYDKLVSQALTTTDLKARTDLDAQAEHILVDTDAIDAPIYYYITNDLTQPNVTRTHSLIGREVYEKWDITS